MSIPGPVPLYRDFMRHYAESLLAADVPKQLDEPETVEPDLSDTVPEPPVVSPSPVKKCVYFTRGATLRGPYSFPRPQHSIDSLMKLFAFSSGCRSATGIA